MTHLFGAYSFNHPGIRMRFKKNRFSPRLKKHKINKEVTEQIKDTERRMKEKIVESKPKEQ